jgi:hypothetical protein
LSLLNNASSIGIEENYSNDEIQLNNFLKLHPMLSMEATSQRTLQLMAGMIEKKNIVSTDLPVIPKSHDDLFLRPANEAIGERACLNGDMCIAKFIAHIRYGIDSPYAFTCTEFLLPDAHKAFLNGRGLPQRRGKCLLCIRYFQNYIYLLARTDPAFKIEDTPLSLQIFCNACAEPPKAAVPEREVREELRASALCTPTHTSPVSSSDGYTPDAMLFVDELFANTRVARETALGNLLWRPCVRFCSTHYKYLMDEDGTPRIIQVGISAEPKTEAHF